MKTLNVKVEDFGKVRLEDHGGFYYVEDEQGNFMGEINPSEIEDWNEDPIILSSIISDLIDEGELETPEIDSDYAYAMDYEE